MTQPSPTPVPDHGSGWGLLFLLADLFGIVALLGVATLVVFVLARLDRRVPKLLVYLVVIGLVGGVGLAGFTILVAATAGEYDIVGLLLVVVFLPIVMAIQRAREPRRSLLVVLAHAALAWSWPFLVGFGLVAGFVMEGPGIPPTVTGLLAGIIVVAGTLLIEHLEVIPELSQSPS